MEKTKEPEVTLELALEHGLTEEEYRKILEILGRKPNYTELGIFSVMWSEHCSYKNSIAVLKTLPRTGKSLLVKAGEENAGLVDIGDGLAVAFKIESHNHPSAIEPFQGAATGVGGILRDIFTMGARPIASLDSLRFGPLTNPRNKYLFDHVVQGIAHYGNCVGVPTVAGEVYFEECYTGNPLVNVMTVGIVEHEYIVSATAKGEGNAVMIVGSATGRDGIHGATFASEELTEESEYRRPSVQVGDPFTEKLLLEASLELAKKGFLVGMQDMGAAGISCSTSEMSARGKSGMIIDLSKVPLREPGMTPYEIMLSESQERMLVVVKKGFEEETKKIFNKWGLNCVEIGKVTNTQPLEIYMNGEKVGEIPAWHLVLGGGAPVYTRKTKYPSYIEEIRAFDIDEIPEPEDYNEVLLKLISSPNIADKSWVFRQYDYSVMTNTALPPGYGAGVLRIKGTRKALAVKTDGNGRYTYLNPYRGGAIAVAEAARNVVCTGARPLAITNCLNFGNPYDEEIYYQFKNAVHGMGDACRVFDTPVTGGNVSFYNESPDGPIYPTVVVGMLGLIKDIFHITTPWFKNEGDFIILIGNIKGELGGSEYLKVIHGLVKGDAPSIDLEFERRIHDAVLEAIRKGIVNSAIDISDGGLAIALAEACIKNPSGPMGASVYLSGDARNDELLFSECQSCIVVTVREDNLLEMEKIASKNMVPSTTIGRVKGDRRLRINTLIDIDTAILLREYTAAIPSMMKGG
ncbi:MAG: phosphoribosylformylglycinamidine synthase subunit PurL [Candidatus Neomarinimicrobiota bacterium]|nr:phosphoribosylformylglycinamidine synthase subunit PurL [Candidatus Neomarinimicrobiota bacterium]RKY53592.1 MAG: phosphoribosylformylglycinamidine synthase subunit PurL [Candidatus Neomarinimicrobiota bacterium]